MSDDKKNKYASQHRNWKPNWSLETLHKTWMVVFGILKVVAGALATVLLIAAVCGFVFMGTLGDYLESDILPSAGLVLENYDMDAPSYVYSVNDNGEIQVLQELYASTDWKKADYEDIPQALIDAAVAIEDKRFYEHQGVDWFTTIKAFANMFFGDETVGGSSITQQLIKNKTGENSVTVQRKVLEFFRATLVEKNYDKKIIMEEYLNSIYMGQGCRGVRSAAEAYFGKELQTLTIAECASLISITNNPSLFDPYIEKEFTYAGETMNGKQRNRHRQMLVLGELLNQGYITREEYDEAVAQELVLKSSIDDSDRWVICTNEGCDYEGVRSSYKTSNKKILCPKCGKEPEEVKDDSQKVYSYFVDTVIQDVAKAMAAQDGVEWNDDTWRNYLDQINRGGYHIYSTIDTTVQGHVDNIYKDLTKIPKTRSAQQLQSAIVVIDNSTGDIVAMAGGVGTDKAHFGQNRATKSRLQSGSSIKPLTIYAPGFELGTLSPATVIKDLPIEYSEKGPWPRNDDRKYNYAYTIFGGIIESVNAVAANSLKKLGTNYGYEFAKDRFGISTLVEDDLQFSSLALGAQYRGVTVRDMANAYATFANNGTYRSGRTWTKVYDSKGNVVLENVQQSRQILSEKTVNYTNYCLNNAVLSGTGTLAKLNNVDVAGKTGSTSSFRDRWFCGYTGHYTAAVWSGYDTPETITLVNSSGNVSARLWKSVMEPVHKGLKNITLYNKSKMNAVNVCLDSGKQATEACYADVRGNRVNTVLVYADDVPAGTCNKHVMVDYCTAGGGVANEGCKHLAAMGSNAVEAKSLVKLTQSDVNDITAAMPFDLNAIYYQDNYVYLVDREGKDLNFKGFKNNANAGVSAPYIVCKMHSAANVAPEVVLPPVSGSAPGVTTPTQSTSGNAGGSTP